MELGLQRKMLRDMLLARAFEERVAQEYAQGNFPAEHVDVMQADVAAEVEEAVRFASESPEPTLDDARAVLDCNRQGEVLV